MLKQFLVDPQKCKGSGICAVSCPGKLISINKQDKLPHWIEGAEQQCILCHHCVSSCPNQAITINKIMEDSDSFIRNNLLKIDPQKCNHDGICTEVCPLQLITLNIKDNLPIPVEQAEKQCIRCGHCVVICPTGALALETIKPGELCVDQDGSLYYGPVSTQTMKPEDCGQFDASLLPSPEQVRHFLSTRRSIRVYKTDPVDRVALSSIIDIACYAPTARNSQPVNWLVIENSREVNFLSGLTIEWMRQVITNEPEMAQSMNLKRLVNDWDKGIDRICHGAPHVIIAHAQSNLPSAQTSCTIALTYLELAAFSAGIGACWAGYFNAAANFYPPMHEALCLPEGHQCFGAMLIGYPRYPYHRIPVRKKANVAWR
ncbi:Ferredoxin-1 [Sporotomaculum syntrophicum]|uniref:Ferredoxin-1 n=1 Tax=Sporotomaculum syntrophicum TaxID=182264 RepID=A0A9D3AWR5_9FIRM|nr:nitroreductase family protein [Sporotomaculum syntrophicum]KAF1085795.1 Ferredoxin-1 [Sporotomaculum syntrophicum]